MEWGFTATSSQDFAGLGVEEGSGLTPWRRISRSAWFLRSACLPSASRLTPSEQAGQIELVSTSLRPQIIHIFFAVCAIISTLGKRGGKRAACPRRGGGAAVASLQVVRCINSLPMSGRFRLKPDLQGSRKKLAYHPVGQASAQEDDWHRTYEMDMQL